MSNRTAWTAGNGAGLTWTTLINSADMASMATGASVLSSVSGIANGTNLDQFMSISAQLAISSSAVAAGANLAFWLADLQSDGSTYGDGLLTAGTPSTSFTPGWNPIAVIPLYASTRATLVGSVNNIIIPPKTFAVIIQNNSGFSLTSGTQTVKYITYNQQLNN